MRTFRGVDPFLNHLDEQRSPQTDATANQIVNQYLRLITLETTTLGLLRGTTGTTSSR